jgi:hypothetical protein
VSPFLHHADAPGRLSLGYGVIELLRPVLKFSWLQKNAREIVLSEVATAKCEEAARLPKHQPRNDQEA